VKVLKSYLDTLIGVSEPLNNGVGEPEKLQSKVTKHTRFDADIINVLRRQDYQDIAWQKL